MKTQFPSPSVPIRPTHTLAARRERIARLWTALRRGAGLLSLVLLLTVHAEDFGYTTNSGTITITSYTGPGGAVSIPGKIHGLPVTSIWDDVFQYNTNLTSITIPNSVATIGDSAFRYCSNLTRITIPDSLTGIGARAFANCTSLTSITIPDSVTTIGGDHFGGGAFANCTNLTSVTIGNSVTSLGDWAFAACSSLTRVTIPNSVIRVGNHVFHSCASLTNLTIGNGVTSIGDGAIASCTSLTAITVDALNSAYSSVDGVLFNRSQTTLIQCPEGKAGSYAMPDSVTNIGGDAFDFCTSLTSVTIPNSVTNIGIAAFQYCYNLNSITIGNSVTSIGVQAFYNCTSLTHVTIPDGVTSIGYAAFVLCTSLTNVTILSSGTKLGDYAFQHCTSLTGVHFQGNAPSLGSFAFTGDDRATIYYLPGATGWSATFGGRPTALWVLPRPLILNSSLGLGAQSNAFSFVISWATSLAVVVEASTDLASPIWSPVGTNTLTGGWSSFSDPQWTNYPARFYRVISAIP